MITIKEEDWVFNYCEVLCHRNGKITITTSSKDISRLAFFEVIRRGINNIQIKELRYLSREEELQYAKIWKEYRTKKAEELDQYIESLLK